MINLNHGELLVVERFSFGKTQNIEVKLGRKIYLVDIDRNVASAFISFYPKQSNERTAYSKYSGEIESVFVNNTACLDREFFENIKVIEKAQKTITRFQRYL